MAKTKIICFANNKGGSGKSTTCSNIGYALSLQNKRVLLVDADMQLNLTLAFFGEEDALSFAKSDKNLYGAMMKGTPISECIYQTAYPNLDLLPSSTLMSGAEYELFTKWQREFVVKKLLAPIVESGLYDYILLDAPPTLGCLVMNLLCAADFLIIPLEASPWGLFGLANMFDFLKEVQQISPVLSLMGVVITKVDTRKNYYKQTLAALEELENVRVFSQIIRLDSAIEWAQDNSKPVIAFKKGSRSALEYVELAKEVAVYADR